jgi:hypothetical protein
MVWWIWRRKGVGQEAERAYTAGLSPFSPFIPFGLPAYGTVPLIIRADLIFLLIRSGNVSQTHPEVFFTNHLGASQSNQVDNHKCPVNYLVIATLLIRNL